MRTSTLPPNLNRSVLPMGPDKDLNLPTPFVIKPKSTLSYIGYPQDIFKVEEFKFSLPSAEPEGLYVTGVIKGARWLESGVGRIPLRAFLGELPVDVGVLRVGEPVRIDVENTTDKPVVLEVYAKGHALDDVRDFTKIPNPPIFPMFPVGGVIAPVGGYGMTPTFPAEEEMKALMRHTRVERCAQEMIALNLREISIEKNGAAVTGSLERYWNLASSIIDFADSKNPAFKR